MITNFDILEFTNADKNNKFELLCEYCGKSFFKKKKKIAKVIDDPLTKKYRFCSLGCFFNHFIENYIQKPQYEDFTYPSKIKKKRRSKNEIYIEEQLKQYYENLEIIYDSSKIIGYNLDIFIPELNIAIDINGLHNYKPIFGKTSFKITKQNNRNKIIECRKKDIKLYTINTSEQKRFNEESSQKYVEKIKKIINHHLFKN